MERFGNNELNKDPILKDLVNYFSPTEELLLKVRSLTHERITKISNYLYSGAIISFSIFLIIFLFFLDWSFTIPIYLGFALPIAFGAMVWLGKHSIARTDASFVITNEHIYLHVKESGTEWIKQIKLTSLKAVIFKNGKSMHGRDHIGRIEFITGDSLVEIYHIDYVPEMSYCQKRIESILYQYGNIKERWQSIQNKLNLQLPTDFQISSSGLDYMARRYKQRTIYIFLAFIITLAIAAIFYLTIPPLAQEIVMQRMAQIMIIVLAVIFGSIPILWWIVEKHRMRKRTTFINKESVLTLYSHQIIFAGKNTRMTIPLTDVNSIDFVKIKQPVEESYKWKIYDGLQMYFLNNTIYFGPLDNFWDIFEVIFCYFIVWKAEQGLLLSKEEIGTGTLPKLPEIDPSDQFFLSFREHLEPEEKLVFHYQTATSVKKHVRYSVIGLIGMIIAFTFTFLGLIEIFDDYYADLYSLLGGTLVGMLFLFIFLFHFIFIFQDLIRRRIHYVFTDRKLLLKYKDSIEPIKYVNIESITPQYRRFPRYNIELRLKNPIEISPLVTTNGYIITIPKSPITSNLNDRITQLIEGAKKQQYK